MTRTVVVAVAVTLLVGCAVAAQGAKPRFDVASVKRQRAPVPSEYLATTDPTIRPGGVLSATHATVESLAMLAYGLKSFQIIDGPDWIRRDYFQIEARSGGESAPERVREMAQSLLEDRFKLVSRRVQRDMRIYELVRAGRTSPKLARCVDGNAPPPEMPIRMPAGAYPFPIMGSCESFQPILTTASEVLGAIVTDKTELEGRWSYTVIFASPVVLSAGPVQAFVDRQNLPSLHTALEEELGLTLKRTTGPVEVLIIDSVQQPVEN
jgi:uncharacterized protein (TIGR03435 family)